MVYVKPDSALPADEQEFLSIRYLYKPLLFVRLKNGRLAVGSGLGSRNLITILNPEGEVEAIADLVRRWATERSQSAAEQRLAPSVLDTIDLSDLNLEDL